MLSPRIPLHLSHTPASRVRGFAALAGLEAGVRGMMISVMPLTVYHALGDAQLVSTLYFFVGLVSMLAGFMVPWLTRHVARRYLYSLGACLYVLGASLAIAGGPVLTAAALLSNAVGTATIFVCFNAYVLDYVARADLGRSQSTQMLYAATCWAVGPVLGVWLMEVWRPLPFLAAAGFAVALLAMFWRLRLGDGRAIQKARGPTPNPVAYLRRFLGQPRLVAGWLFAVIRSCGWWVYVVYVPIFCIEAGLGDKVGGTMLSLSNALLFAAPLMLRVAHRWSVRSAVRGAFVAGGVLFALAWAAAPLPWSAVALLAAGSVSLVMLDVVGGLPFLMAVKPSERTEMAAVYASFRDVSGILTPGVAWLVLLAAPVAGVFAACGAAMLGASAMAARLHPRLGVLRPSRGGVGPLAAE